MSLLLPSSVRPSYGSGFASPQLGGMAHPELWEGCAASYNAGLGVTGAMLFDHSGRRKDGTLTNMDIATDWVDTPYGSGLETDGTNDHIVIDAVDMSGGITYAAWIIVKDATSDQGVISCGSNDSFFDQRKLARDV